MPSATVTVRELKNKDTCIDISVPTYKKTKGLVQSTFVYHVVVVSSLPFFKSAKHKPSDVVQYMMEYHVTVWWYSVWIFGVLPVSGTFLPIHFPLIPLLYNVVYNKVSKKFGEFEDVHAKINARFSETVLPPLSKKSLLVTDTMAKERHSNLDTFMKFLACTPKLSTSSCLLEFLGVNAIKAGKFRKDEELEEDVKSSDDPDNPSKQEVTSEVEQNLFDEEEEEDADDYFTSDDTTEDTLTSTGTAGAGDTKLFEDPDLSGAFTEEDAGEFVLPGAMDSLVTKDTGLFTDEDNSDLYRIDDDLDKFMKIETKKPETKPKPATRPPESIKKPTVPDQKPTVSTQKPSPAPRKPKIDAKPKSSNASLKPVIKPKSGVSAKPVLPRKPGGQEVKQEEEVNKVTETLGTDDIMQYIQRNTSQDDDLDLFS